MRIAVPVNEDNGLDSTICEHFGHAPYFAIIDVEGEDINLSIFPNPAIEHAAGQIPRMLAEKNVNMIIASRMGEKAKLFFKQFGIEAVTGASGTLRDVVARITA
ncbi:MULTISPECIES: NifB/NifX family molybdenum-iron cluster-binding protein [unclassified Desulfurobacterium]|uniref:NifB/NifX family molybdenum-iron cluster-binding protein n=1 Tax=unclassified Desulfurobacterium TaxID=2639089 RepID=UPI0003B61658|nr:MULTISPECIES: NifB/NifX family molybdenum-iron cluster-binding protein [unclassified Desulfurobacterium]